MKLLLISLLLLGWGVGETVWYLMPFMLQVRFWFSFLNWTELYIHYSKQIISRLDLLGNPLTPFPLFVSNKESRKEADLEFR